MAAIPAAPRHLLRRGPHAAARPARPAAPTALGETLLGRAPLRLPLCPPMPPTRRSAAARARRARWPARRRLEAQQERPVPPAPRRVGAQRAAEARVEGHEPATTSPTCQASGRRAGRRCAGGEQGLQQGVGGLQGAAGPQGAAGCARNAAALMPAPSPQAGSPHRPRRWRRCALSAHLVLALGTRRARIPPRCASLAG